METTAALDALGALSQGTRLEAFRMLIRHEPEGLAAGELARLLSVPPNTLSAHLNVLTHARLVTSERRSRSIVYRARLSELEELVLFLLECSSERSDQRRQILKNVMRQLSVRPRGP